PDVRGRIRGSTPCLEAGVHRRADSHTARVFRRSSLNRAMDTIALLAHKSAAAVAAYRGGQPISAKRLLDDAQRLARALPPGRHMLNVCSDRYRFAVGFAACLMTRRVSLLPSTHTPEVIAQLAAFAPDAFCLTDDLRCDIELPQVYFPE